MNLKPSTFGRLEAIQHIFATKENAKSESINSLFKECYSHSMRIDSSLKNKIIASVNLNKEKLDEFFIKYGEEDSSTLFYCFFYAMSVEALFLKKPIAIIWSEYGLLAKMFFHHAEINALKAILNKISK